MDPQTDQNPKQQLVERLKAATNILVTVSTDPSVDQLAACIGLTLWLNKLGKHATAVFSGEVPSTLEFLQPEDTLEKNTDSLRDFIISLDKSKADKLRYKVEDRVVKIFITPYRTNLSADDLEFSQGDFNVDAIVALGVAEQQDLDNAITSHGRILHDATVMSINTVPSGGVGSINWHDAQASSLCELVMDVGRELGKDQLDGQIATALLTGIVAETDRFSNEKTLPTTMSISAELMSAGANQQLVASKLEGPSVQLQSGSDDKPSESAAAPATDDGTLEIGHKHAEEEAPVENPNDEESEASVEPQELPQPDATEEAEASEAGESHLINTDKAPKLVTEPPQLGGTLTANTAPERPEQEPATDPLSTGNDEQPLLNHEESVLPLTQEVAEEPEQAPPGSALPQWDPPAFLDKAIPADTAPVLQPAPSTPTPESAPGTPEPNQASTQAEQAAPVGQPNETLSQLEQEVGAHQETAPEQTEGSQQSQLAESARNNLQDAYASGPSTHMPNLPVEALNAQPVDLNPPAPAPEAPQQPAQPAPSVAFDPTAFGAINDPDAQQAPKPLQVDGATVQPSAGPVEMPADPDAPPPVPPPFNPVQPPTDQDKQTA